MAGMRRVMPKMESLKETYGDDRMKLAAGHHGALQEREDQSVWWVLADAGSDASFIALYWVLLESVELRHAAFGLWLQDLSVPGPYYPASADGGDHVPANKLSPTPPILYRPE